MGPETKTEFTLFFLNVGTEGHPQWECINPHPFDKFDRKLTLREKLRRFAHKIIFALVKKRDKE